MQGTNADVPVHDSLHVTEAVSLYQNDEWWKAVVTYQFEGDSDTDETAMYLWHDDGDGWTRKNKYVIKTPDAWAVDRELIDDYIRSDAPTTETTAFPVSDYYTVGAGETVFQSDSWWKAIVNITGKGSWETNEVMVYLWQEQDGEWRRRQKYTIKRVSDWEEECEVIDDLMLTDHETSGTGSSVQPDGDVAADIEALRDELETHLSGEFT
ncbi:hypothetical protein [Halosimplex amylolyticum]|uniref:hypothetical protein n=1 Tax=Halosimplex amylolyticum TaxID=3396616 RepID=UPI003F554F29